MIEVFITNITKDYQAKKVIKQLYNRFLDFKIDYDLNETVLHFPCGHTVIRLEGERISVESIVQMVRQMGFECQVMPDTICVKN
ncbi:hypothetical protein [Flavobacterium sp. NRK F7]|uniref:hypothetical protein n=1 Tax=Flavobacterium sp. NRK F7 TaxID=2954930 RepID=UPI0020908FA5|nr:hypothetical protein [Flavobacterium sp. NRK F7]MCO6164462.1 hypothetical protein [Flavobacterium sp. NRK F7]